MQHKHKLWLFFFLGAWLVPTILATFLTPSLKLRFAFIVWQQALFILGGLAGSRREIFKPLKFSTLWKGLLLGVTLFFLNGTLSVFSQWAVAKLFGQELVQSLILQERAPVELFLQSENQVLVTGMMLLLVIGAPLGEELFFRGFLLENLKGQIGAFKAVLLSALLFALLHFYLIQFIPVYAAGIFLGLLLVKTEDIMIPIIAHGISNFLALLIFLGSL